MEFFDVLNALHPSLQFTMENESDGKLPFMDVLVKRSDGKITRSMYRKPTFTGLHTRWDSFAPTAQKIALMRSLTSRAHRICSPSLLNDELEILRVIFAENRYPLHLVRRVIKHMEITTESGIQKPDKKKAVTPCGSHPVMLRLPWIGMVGTKFSRDIRSTVQTGFPGTDIRVIFTTTKQPGHFRAGKRMFHLQHLSH